MPRPPSPYTHVHHRTHLGHVNDVVVAHGLLQLGELDGRDLKDKRQSIGSMALCEATVTIGATLRCTASLLLSFSPSVCLCLSLSLCLCLSLTLSFSAGFFSPSLLLSFSPSLLSFSLLPSWSLPVSFSLLLSFSLSLSFCMSPWQARARAHTLL